VCPEFERYITDARIVLIKFWLEVGQEEQVRRFLARINDSMRQWKLSPMDLESYRRWYDYSHARDRMFKATDTDCAPWHIVRSDAKKTRAAQLHRGDARPYPLQKDAGDEGQIAEAFEQRALRRSGLLARAQFCSREILTG
jgi:hypothetical protein